MFAVLVVAALAGDGAATPNRCTHTEQSFIGANATHFFFLEWVRQYPGSYYDHAEILRVCGRRKLDSALDDSVMVYRAGHHRDLNTLEDAPVDVKPLPAFDLAGFMRARRIHGATVVENEFAVDSTGIYAAGAGKRAYLLHAAELHQQLPARAVRETLAVHSVYRVYDSWNRVPAGEDTVVEWYLLVDVGRPGGDVDWGRFVVYAPQPKIAR